MIEANYKPILVFSTIHNKSSFQSKSIFNLKAFEFTCPQHGSVLRNAGKVSEVVLSVHVHVTMRSKLVVMIVPHEPIPKVRQ